MQTGTTDAKKMRIGEILLTRRLISRLELNAALAHQKRWGGRLGAVLTHLGFISEEVLIGVLAEIYRFPIVNLTKTEISDEATAAVSFELAKKHNVLPLKAEGTARKTLHLAVSDPSCMEALDEIRFLTGISQIRTYLAGASDIRNAIERVYLTRASPGRAVLYSPLSMEEANSTGPDMVIIRGGQEELLSSGLEQGEKGASGSLADMGLTDIIQILGSGGKTAEISLQYKGEEGKIYLEGGRIVHAVQKYLQGEKAFYEMLKWNEGGFTIVPVDAIRTRTIHVSNDGLILEGLRQQDEAGVAVKEEDNGIAYHEVSGESAIQVEGAGGSGGPPMDLGAMSFVSESPAPPDLEPVAPIGPPPSTARAPTPAPGASSNSSPGSVPTESSPADRKPFAPPEAQVKLLLKLLLRKGLLTEREARLVLYGKS